MLGETSPMVRVMVLDRNISKVKSCSIVSETAHAHNRRINKERIPIPQHTKHDSVGTSLTLVMDFGSLGFMPQNQFRFGHVTHFQGELKGKASAAPPQCVLNGPKAQWVNGNAKVAVKPINRGSPQQ